MRIRPQLHTPAAKEQQAQVSPEVGNGPLADIVSRSGVVGQLRAYHAIANGPIVPAEEKAGSQQGDGVAQLKVTHDGTKYVGDGNRPGWRAALKVNVAAEAGVGPKANFAQMGMDRAHRIPYATIEELVVKYCNGAMTQPDFETATDGLFDQSGPEYKPMLVARHSLQGALAGSIADICKAANTLLSILNSSSFNVSPGDDSTNRSIQDHVDYGYAPDPSGSGVVLTPRSQQLHDAYSGIGMEPDLPLTPKGKHVKSSQISSMQQQSGAKVKAMDVELS